MFHWAYDLATGEFLHGGPCEVTAGSGQAVVRLLRNPKPSTERYDGAGGIRAATAQEIVDYETAQDTARTLAQFDTEKLVKALAIWTAGKLNVSLGQAKTEILAIYRTLP